MGLDKAFGLPPGARTGQMAAREGLAMGVTDEQKLLADEYMFLQRAVEEFDAKALTIKGWSVTVGSAAIAAAIQQDVPELLLAAASSAVGFWLTEVIRKGQQRTFYFRIFEIERYFERSFPDTRPLQISTTWWRAHLGKDPPSGRPRSNFLTPLILPGVLLPHIAIAGAALFLNWNWADPKPDARPAVEQKKR